MSTTSNAELAQTLYGHFNRNEFDAILEHVSDDCEIVILGWDMAFHGKEGFRAYIGNWKTMAPDSTVTVVRQIASDTELANEAIFRGTNTGPLSSPAGEIPATGKTVELPFVELWTFEDGQVVSLHNYGDTMQVMAQLGLLPAPETAAAG